MAFNLTIQVRSISEVTRAVAYGDLNRSIDVDVSGEMLELKLTINEMVKRLGDFSREVTRLAAEVDMEDKLGDQAEVAGIQGTWKDLTDNVNVCFFLDHFVHNRHPFLQNMIRRRKPVKPDTADEQTLEQTSTEEVLVPITTIASSRNPVIHLESLRGLYTAVLFGLPGHYLRDAPPQTLLGCETWIEASRTVHKRWMKEWTQMGTAAGVLFR
jgi:HAMP domain-containing protein